MLVQEYLKKYDNKNFDSIDVISSREHKSGQL